VSSAIREVAGISFLDGFQAACTTVGVVAILGALLSLKFLPERTPTNQKTELSA
jgi:hypothetical protein